MPAEQHDKDYGYRTMVRVIVMMGALMLVLVFIIPHIDDGPKMSPTGWVLITLWFAILVAGTIWACQVERRYRCQQCGARLPMLPLEASTKYQHRFHCPACDVIWTTDVYLGDT